MKTPRTFIVALEIKSRYYRPSVGNFLYHTESGRQALHNEETSDIGRLAELTNEALEFLRVNNQVDHVVVVVEVFPKKEKPAPEPVVEPVVEEPVVEPVLEPEPVTEPVEEPEPAFVYPLEPVEPAHVEVEKPATEPELTEQETEALAEALDAPVAVEVQLPDAVAEAPEVEAPLADPVEIEPAAGTGNFLAPAEKPRKTRKRKLLTT